MARILITSARPEEGKTTTAWILEQYLNTSSYGTVNGRTAIGVQAAADIYFSKPAKELNLQEAASIVVHLEVPWNPAVLEQRVGRVHRMGQKRAVRVLHFVTKDAIEEKVRQVVDEKRALFAGVMTEGVDHVVFDETARASLVERVGKLISERD